MTALNLVQAGAAVARSKSAILKAIRTGRVAANRDPITNGWLIEPAELHRVYPPRTGSAPERSTQPQFSELLEEVRARLADAQAQVEDLRFRLTSKDQQLVDANARIAGLLTDRRPARWWRR